MNPQETLKTGAPGLAEPVIVENPKLLTELVTLVKNMPDGVTGLFKQFQDRGLGQVVTALKGDAVKTEITPEQIVKGFDPAQITALAKTTGLDPKILPEKIATLLPKVVEQLAPVGKFTAKL